MAKTRGRCTNFDKCALASQRTNIEVRIGDNFVCPGCGAQLSAPVADETTQARRSLAIAGVAAVLAAGSALGAYLAFEGLGEGRHATAAADAALPNQLAQAAPAAIPAQHPAAPQLALAPLPAMALSPAAVAAATPETVLFRVRGSNTIGATLAPKLAAAFLSDTGDTNVSIEPQSGVDETKVSGQRAGERETIVISAHGSATAFTGLAAGDTDIGMASRRIKPAEVDSLVRLGDMTSAASEHVLALDGIAVIVNPANPLNELTKSQLRDIFGGIITDWSRLGGASGPIHVFARDDKSGTYDTFKALVLDKIKLATGTRRVEDSRELTNGVTADPAAIGFVGLPYVADAKSVAIAETGATPLLANRLTVATEDYPLSRRLYLYTPTIAQNRLAQRFVAYALSPSGQAIVEQTGFIPLTLKTETVTIPDTASARYRALVGNARRLSTNFRFQPNSTNLDNRALRDLDRLVNFLISMHTGGDHIVLVGFADNQGVFKANYDVSKKRADTVSALLLRRGVRVGHVAAFGSELPVADNVTPETREKNRRVEVYLDE